MKEKLNIPEGRIEWHYESEPVQVPGQKASVFALSAQLKYSNFIAEDYAKEEVTKENRSVDCLTILNGFALCEPNLRKSTFDPNHCYASDVIKQMEDMMNNKKLSVDEHHSDQLLVFMALA